MDQIYKYAIKSCDICRNFEKTSDQARLALDILPSDLISSVTTTDCLPCLIISQAIREFEDTSWCIDTDVSRIYVYGLAFAEDTISMEVYFKDDRPKRVFEVFHATDGKGKITMPWRAIRSKTSVSGHPLDDDAIAWVKKLLENCVEFHDECSLPIFDAYPARMLHINKTSEGKIQVNLVPFSFLGNKQYAALSHCWGSHRTCITTSSNLEGRQNGIPWEDIPKTYQEAIIYCLELNIHFVWIDALCIIQDNRDDWEIESAKMAGIYQNSFLTFAAMAADCDTAGCFAEPSLLPYDRVINGLPVDAPQISVREKLDHWSMPLNRKLRALYPLLTRGWALQERLLAPRIIHFCKQELVWECGQTLTCECQGIRLEQGTKWQFPMTNFARKDAKIPNRALKSSSRDKSSGHDSDGEEDTAASGFSQVESMKETRNTNDLLFRLGFRFPRTDSNVEMKSWEPLMSSSCRDPEKWHRIVEQYSTMELSKASDYLVALSGLANRISGLEKSQGVGNGRYVVGLWQDSLYRDLLWRVDTPTRFLPEYRAPTWSWASVSSPVKYWSRAELKENVFYTAVDARDQMLYKQTGVTAVHSFRSPHLAKVSQRRKGSNKQDSVSSSFGNPTKSTRSGPPNAIKDLQGHPSQMAPEDARDTPVNHYSLSTQWLANRSLLDGLDDASLDWCIAQRAAVSFLGMEPELRDMKYDIESVPGNLSEQEAQPGLALKGSIRTAGLRYNRNPAGLKYELAFKPAKFQERRPNQRSERRPNLDTELQEFVLPFYADYAFQEYSDPRTRPGATVYLLEVLVNLYLVLVETWETGEQYDGEEISYKRIGIFRAPLSFDRIYGIDFMRGSDITAVQIF